MRSKPRTPSSLDSQRHTSGTWRWLCVKYFAECADYLRYDERQQRVRRQLLEATFSEPIKPGSPRVFRDIPLFKMTANEIEVLRDRKLAFPEGANNRIKAIRAVYKWAVQKKLVTNNPARDVSLFQSDNPDGYHTWSVEEVQQFLARHPIGTKAALALGLLLFTGQRRSDVTRFGKQHIRGGKLVFVQYKGRKHKPHKLTLPVLPTLQHIINSSPCGDLTFLVNERDAPFSDAGFGNWFRDRCVEAGVPGRAHGLRKAGATIAANNGATPHQLMAIFGWHTLKMAEHYTRAADQERLAESGMSLLSLQNSFSEQKGTESCPTFESSGTFSAKK